MLVLKLIQNNKRGLGCFKGKIKVCDMFFEINTTTSRLFTVLCIFIIAAKTLLLQLEVVNKW